MELLSRRWVRECLVFVILFVLCHLCKKRKTFNGKTFVKYSRVMNKKSVDWNRAMNFIKIRRLWLFLGKSILSQNNKICNSKEFFFKYQKHNGITTKILFSLFIPQFLLKYVSVIAQTYQKPRKHENVCQKKV